MSEESKYLIGWLEARDIPCPVCRYNLRDLKVPTCPECSAPLRLAVASPSTNMAPWFVACVALALAVGFDGVVTVLISFGLIVFPPKAIRPAVSLLGAFLVLTLICIACLVRAYRARPRWAYWPRARQWWTAIAIFAATGIGHAVFGVLLPRWLR